jgi:hypothetical protein
MPPNISQANLVIWRATSSSRISITMFETSIRAEAPKVILGRRLEAVEEAPKLCS